MTRRVPVIITRADSRDWVFHLNRHYCDITPTENAPFGIAVNELEPGGATTRHAHDVVELFLVTKGRIEAKVGQEAHILNPGDSCFVPSMAEHNILNLSDKNASEFVCIWWSQAHVEPS